MVPKSADHFLWSLCKNVLGQKKTDSFLTNFIQIRVHDFQKNIGKKLSLKKKKNKTLVT